jgi:hypothetical protein
LLRIWHPTGLPEKDREPAQRESFRLDLGFFTKSGEGLLEQCLHVFSLPEQVARQSDPGECVSLQPSIAVSARLFGGPAEESRGKFQASGVAGGVAGPAGRLSPFDSGYGRPQATPRFEARARGGRPPESWS